MPFGIGKTSGSEYSDHNSSEMRDLKNFEPIVSTRTSSHDNPPSPNPRTEASASHELRFLKRLHRWDPNLDSNVNSEMRNALTAHDKSVELDLINFIENDSPYPEVRAAVRNYDVEYECNTVRAWVIGFVMVTIGSAMNMLFSLRYPQIQITSFVAQLVSYPIGCAWDYVVPLKWRGGQFNMKEHTIIVIMANVTFGGGVAYSTDTIVALKGFYGYDLGVGWGLLITFGTQMIGFGLAGILRRYLVWPSSMIWPSNFVNTSLFYALHDHTPTDPLQANGWSIHRYKYFFFVFLGSFIWYWFPGWIFQALSLFAFATWIAPNNVVVNQLFGYQSGLGLIPITFDWTQITGFTLSPLMFPWHAIANTLIGVVIFFMIMCTGLHFSGWNYSAYLQMSSSLSYDNRGNVYDVSQILTSDYTLDLAKYQAYSPLFLSTTFAVAYGLSFAAITALITHIALFHGQEIWIRARLSFGEEPDIHTKMMNKYKEAPEWWFAATFFVLLGVSLAAILAFPTHLSWWAFFIALLISAFFAIPIGMIQAITNVQLGLNVMTEFIAGYMLPGKPLAMMLFKTYGYITMTQALSFCQDLKLGVYMKIPPRTMFAAQMLATVWSSIVQIAVLYWSFANIKDLCDPNNEEHWVCPGGQVFYTASVIWGLIGPQRIFNPGQVYHSLLYFFVAGALAPPIFYVLARLWPKSNLRYLSAPLIFGGSGNLPPATTINYTTWGIVGFVFNKVIKNKYRGWWSHYNYITSAGLDTGLAISTIVIFLTLQLTNANYPNWWGNNVVFSTLDANFEATQVPINSTQFGPATW